MTPDPEAILTSALDVLFPDGPFFGGRTAGIQGAPTRHLWMSATISLFADLARPLRLVEIGSWIGASALTFAQAIDDFCPHKGSILCVDPWGDYFSAADRAKGDSTYEEMASLGRSGLAHALFRHNIRFAKPGVPIEGRRGVSRDILPGLESEAFDVVYVDGSHYRDDVVFDIEQGTRLLRDGGILCGDDLELQGHECDLGFAQAQVDQDFVVDPAGRWFHPGVTLAVHATLGAVSCFGGFWLMRKTGAGFAPVSLLGARTIIPAHFPADIKTALLDQINRPPAR